MNWGIVSMVRGFLSAGLVFSLGSCQLNFVSLGNWGSGGPEQRLVGSTLKHHARDRPFAFVVSPGSNFMEGVEDLDDRRWETQFADVYDSKELNLQWFGVLGAADWDGNATAEILRTNLTYGMPLNKGLDLEHNSEFHIDQEKIDDMARREKLPRDRKGPQWTVPNFFYHYTQSFPDAEASNALKNAPEVSVLFAFIDTKIMGQGFPSDPATKSQWGALKNTLEMAKKTHDWVIVVADQAITGSGSKGGSAYFRKNLLPLLTEHNVDLYISGSDKNMEAIADDDAKGLWQINCGSGSGGAGSLRSKAKGQEFYSSSAGFCRHKITSKSLRTEFIDGKTGRVLDTVTMTPVHKPHKFSDKLHYFNKLPYVEYTALPPGVGGAPGGLFSTFGTRHPNSLFVTLVGFTGLAVLGIVVFLAIVTMAKRLHKYNK